MPIPSADPLPHLVSQEELTRWATRLVQDLEKTLRRFRLYPQVLVLPNGNSNNLDLKEGMMVRLTGPTGVFAVTGIAGGYPGRILVLRNATTQQMTLANENAGSEANNRIKTMTGADVTSFGEDIAFLVYDDNRWNLTSW